MDLVDTCLVCRVGQKTTILDLGPQPASSRFTASSRKTVAQHRLALAVCANCGTLQLAVPFPVADLISPHDWLVFNEPETHLDAVADNLCRLPGLRPGAAIGGISVKDTSMLERLRRRGFTNVGHLDLAAEHGTADAPGNFASLPTRLTPAVAARIVASRGPFDLLIARHVVEHAPAPRVFLEALGSLLVPGGYLVIEVPDCLANLRRRDYTMIWEEHVLYITAQTARQLLEPTGCRAISTEIHPLPYEDVIVICAQKSSGGAARHAAFAPEVVKGQRLCARDYGAAFGGWTARYRDLFKRLAGDGRRLAAYGAGHLTCGFLNYHGLADYFAFVVDDTPQKQGLFLPKCGLPVVSRARLNPQEIGACLLGLSPALEERIIANNPAFVAGGGKFYSLLVDSKRSIRNLM